MRVLIKMVDALGVEGRGTALQAVHFVAFLQQQLRQIGAVLAGDAGNQSAFRHVLFQRVSGAFRCSTQNRARRQTATRYSWSSQENSSQNSRCAEAIATNRLAVKRRKATFRSVDSLRTSPCNSPNSSRERRESS